MSNPQEFDGSITDDEEEEEIRSFQDMSVHEARRWLMMEGRNQKGTRCPCCSQNVQVYKRTMNRSLILSMFHLYHANRKRGWEEYIHVNELDPIVNQMRELAKCAYRGWKLIESKINEDTKKRCSGFWRMTERGVLFLKGALWVPDHLWVYNDRVIEISENPTSVRHALRETFDYEELMNEVYRPRKKKR